MDYLKNSDKIIEKLARPGGFLTVKNGDILNTMTIGWGGIDFMWGRGIFMVMVRKSRYTYEIIEKAADFTVSIPEDGSLNSALGFCGSKSGRDFDKFNECGLKAVPAKTVNSPVVECKGFIFECKKLLSVPMIPELLDDDVKKTFYGDNDFHTLYYGEITDYYTI